MQPRRRRTLWALTEGHRGLYAAAILAMGLGNVFLFGVPLVSKAAIDELLAGEGGPGGLVRAALLIVGLTAVAGGLQYVRGRWAAIASEGIVRRLRDRMFAHLDRLPVAFHDRADTGDLVQRCTSDVETVRVFLAQQVVELGRVALLIATVTPILVWLDGRMALVSLALYPFIVAFAVIFFRRIRSLFLEMDEAEGRMTAVLQENLTGIRVVRAFSREEHEIAKFAAHNGEFRDKNFRLIRLLGTYFSVSDVLCLGQIGLVLFAGAFWVQRGELGLGTLFAFLTYQAIVIWPVRHMGRILADTSKATVSLGRLREILDEPEETDRTIEPGSIVQGEIVVENLSFAFGDGRPALEDVSFRVRSGETLALLGPPGSGKSTLIHLLLRLHDYEHGSVRLDGRELADLPRRAVRRSFAVVLQEPFLYSKTIGANVSLGHGAADDEEVVRAAQAACIHESITGFHDGYDTLVGERGVTLSGGQRQRLAIARALLKDAPILVLDDALSAVDTRTEARILAALAERRGRRTTVLIAHRLSSVVHADRILVLEEGRVVQSGTHEDLVRAEGPYRRLWRIQGVLEDELRPRAAEVRR